MGPQRLNAEGRFDEEVGAMTMTMSGGWSRRETSQITYNHTYCSLQRDGGPVSYLRQPSTLRRVSIVCGEAGVNTFSSDATTDTDLDVTSK